jgi:excisionase family DNA binding protein
MSGKASRNPHDTDQKRLYSLREASSYLGVSYWSVRDLIHAGSLHYVKIGRRVLIDLKDLERFVESQKECFTF